MCLTGLVGIRNRCGDTSTPIHYIDDLPAIDTQLLSKSTSSDDSSLYDLVDKQIELAEKYIIEAVRKQLNPKFESRSVINNGSIAKFGERVSSVSRIGDFDGFRLQLGRSDYLKLLIHKVWIHTTNTDTINIKLYDLAQGKELQSTTVTGVADEIVEAELNWEVSNETSFKDLFLGHDHSSYYKATVKGCASCNGYKVRNGTNSARFYQKSISGTKIASNLDNLPDASMSFSYSVRCDFENFLCESRNLWGLAMLHKTAQNIYEQARFNTGRFNDLIVHSADLDLLIEKSENEFNMNMREALQGLEIPKGVCFKCANPVRLMTKLP